MVVPYGASNMKLGLAVFVVAFDKKFLEGILHTVEAFGHGLLSIAVSEEYGERPLGWLVLANQVVLAHLLLVKAEGQMVVYASQVGELELRVQCLGQLLCFGVVVVRLVSLDSHDDSIQILAEETTHFLNRLPRFNIVFVDAIVSIVAPLAHPPLLAL